MSRSQNYIFCRATLVVIGKFFDHKLGPSRCNTTFSTLLLECTIVWLWQDLQIVSGSEVQIRAALYPDQTPVTHKCRNVSHNSKFFDMYGIVLLDCQLTFGCRSSRRFWMYLVTACLVRPDVPNGILSLLVYERQDVPDCTLLPLRVREGVSFNRLYVSFPRRRGSHSS